MTRDLLAKVCENYDRRGFEPDQRISFADAVAMFPDAIAAWAEFVMYPKTDKTFFINDAGELGFSGGDLSSPDMWRNGKWTVDYSRFDVKEAQQHIPVEDQLQWSDVIAIEPDAAIKLLLQIVAETGRWGYFFMTDDGRLCYRDRKFVGTMVQIWNGTKWDGGYVDEIG